MNIHEPEVCQMAIGKDWPDPGQPGVPENPNREGPHLVMDSRGKRRWAWWTPPRSEGNGDWTTDGGESGAGQNWTYIGPAQPPDGKPV